MTQMTSSQALEPMRHVVEDVKLWDPGLGCTVEAFYREVERRALSRGWKQLLLLDLPALGALYDQGLSSGAMDLAHVPASFGVLTGGRFPDSWVFRTLLQHTFDGTGTLDESTPVEVVAATRQLLYLYKKANYECPEEATRDAVTDYVRIEECMRTPSGSWDHDVWIPCRFSFSRSGDSLLAGSGLGARFWRILDGVCAFLCPRVWLRPDSIVPKHGPGAVSDVQTGEDKYSLPYWPTKLAGTFPPEWHGLVNETLGVDTPWNWSEKEPPCRLLAVPKTFKGPRLIASEPVSHQFLQQGLMRWIRSHQPDALRACVDFLDQTPSRDAALEGSRTGNLATVDLSSASDRLSCWVVERAFSSNQSLLAALHASRTRVVVDGTGTHGGLAMRLKKFAAQGSAVTFPVQTIVYAAVAITSVLYDDGCRTPTLDDVMGVARGVRVFGDDIVVPSPNVLTLSAALQALGLKVNGKKTHSRGRFRESCGMDAYQGHDVTPVYVADLQLQPNPEGFVSWFDVSNRFHKAGLWKTAAWMLAQVPTRELFGITYSHADGPGIRAFTFCRGTRFHGAVRNHRPSVYGPIRPNEGLQVQERRVLCIDAIVDRKARGSFQDLLQYFLEEPAPDTPWVAGVPGRNRVRIRTRWVPIH